MRSACMPLCYGPLHRALLNGESMRRKHDRRLLAHAVRPPLLQSRTPCAANVLCLTHTCRCVCGSSPRAELVPAYAHVHSCVHAHSRAAITLAFGRSARPGCAVRIRMGCRGRAHAQARASAWELPGLDGNATLLHPALATPARLPAAAPAHQAAAAATPAATSGGPGERLPDLAAVESAVAGADSSATAATAATSWGAISAMVTSGGGDRSGMPAGGGAGGTAGPGLETREALVAWAPPDGAGGWSGVWVGDSQVKCINACAQRTMRAPCCVCETLGRRDEERICRSMHARAGACRCQAGAP